MKYNLTPYFGQIKLNITEYERYWPPFAFDEIQDGPFCVK